jgi:hypothetical protein
MNSNKSNLEIEAIENHILALSTEIRESNNNIINDLKSYLSFKSSTLSPISPNFPLEINYIINYIDSVTIKNEDSSTIDINKTRLYIAMEKRQKLATDFQ